MCVMSGDRTIGGFTRLPGGPVSVVIPLTLVSARRGAALACRAPRAPVPSPPRWPGGTLPLPLEVRLDALGAVVLDGLSYRRAARTPSGAPHRPGRGRCRPSMAICCGVTVAGPGAAMSTSCWRSRACVRSWTPPASPPWSTGDSEGWPRPARAGTRRSGTDAPRPAHAGRTRPQPPPGRAARPGGAGDRASGQRVDAAALAWPAVPGPGRLPGRRGAHLPRPMDPPHPDMKEASGHPH
jgi:hypothetical protein